MLPPARRFLMIVMGVLASAPACGGNDGPPPLPPAEYAEALSQLLCDKAYECCSEAQRSETDFFAGPRAACEATLSLYGIPFDSEQAGVESVVASIAKGRIAYDGRKAAACLEEIRGLSCAEASDKPFWTRPLCAVVTAQVTAGGTCESRDECESKVCDQEGEAPGMCRARKTAGATCLEDDDCESGWCGEDPSATGASDEVELTCLSRKPDGQDCQDDFECQSGACRELVCGPPAPEPLCGAGASD